MKAILKEGERFEVPQVSRVIVNDDTVTVERDNDYAVSGDSTYRATLVEVKEDDW